MASVLLRVALVAAVAIACTPEAPITRGKNLVLITLDTTRADALSCLGGDPRTTPNLDALAASGTLFTNARSETNATNPSHVTMFTGLRAIEHGVMNNLTILPANVETLPEVLRRAGYATAAFVAVSHLAHPLGWRGFDTFPNVMGELGAAEVTDRALSWLAGAHEPFFLWVHYFDPHMLYAPPAATAAAFYQGDRMAGGGEPIARDEYFQKVRFGSYFATWLGETRDPKWAPAMYAGELHHADAQIGRLLDRLDDDTVVVAVADHGESLGEHGILYDHKGLYEPSLRIPLIIRVPGLAPVRSDAAVSTLDLAETIAELLGVRLGASAHGLSLVPLLKGQEDGAFAARGTHVYQSAGNHAVAVRQGDWKLIWVINKEHKLLPISPQLFDLGQDPAESNDLADQHPERVAAMRQLVEPWVLLGTVPDNVANLDPRVVQQLRELGYLGGN